MVKLLKWIFLCLSFFLVFSINIKAEEVDGISVSEPSEYVETEKQEEKEEPKEEVSETNGESNDVNQPEEEPTRGDGNGEEPNSTEVPTEVNQVEEPTVVAQGEGEVETGNATAETENTTPEAGNATAETGNATDESYHAGTIYDVQKVKVITSKIDPDGNHLVGAHLQILDSNGNVVDDWTSDGKAHETLLPDGDYTLHEVSAPDGYELAADKKFNVKVIIEELTAGVDYDKTPCSHYGGVPLYYIEIKGVPQEVYCINQNWETPDEGSIYDGEILDSGSIRDYTKQTIVVDVDPDSIDPVDERPHSGQVFSETPVDISDQTLSDQELYDKILDIIYHRYKAMAELGKLGYEYTETEIRYITEVALKNYTNAGLTERQFNVAVTQALLDEFDAAGVVYKTYNNGKRLTYIKHNYRDYVYVKDAADNESIVRTEYGKGNSFGQMVAGHWASNAHGADTSGSATALAARATVARYYVLFEYLIRDEDHHPDDMNLYIYSSLSRPLKVSKNDYEPNGGKYQNLLGVTGYFEVVDQQELDVNMTDEYSTEKRDITVEKVWDDKEDYEHLRPTTVTVNLYADKVLIQTVELTEENGWFHKFENLDVYNKGNKIIYTIDENKVVEYDTNIEGDMDEGFTIINSHYGTGGDNPPTSDNIFMYITMLVISLLGLFKYTYCYIKE